MRKAERRVQLTVPQLYEDVQKLRHEATRQLRSTAARGGSGTWIGYFGGFISEFRCFNNVIRFAAYENTPTAANRTRRQRRCGCVLCEGTTNSRGNGGTRRLDNCTKDAPSEGGSAAYRTFFKKRYHARPATVAPLLPSPAFTAELRPSHRTVSFRKPHVSAEPYLFRKPCLFRKPIPFPEPRPSAKKNPPR